MDMDPQQDIIVFLHGLGRCRLSMTCLATRFHRRGYRTLNIGYPSRRYPIRKLTDIVHHTLERRIPSGIRTVHAVTHSLGSILWRQLLKNGPPFTPGRVVMLAPPNQGSELADHFCDHAWFRSYAGPAGCELGTGTEAIPARLGPVSSPTGIIAGHTSWSLFDRWLPGDHDGRVLRDNTSVAGMTDWIQIPYGHSFIMYRKTVFYLTLSFLRTGHFLPPVRSDTQKEER
jgi:hypothetical protein